jgi:hypothetical protein
LAASDLAVDEDCDKNHVIVELLVQELWSRCRLIEVTVYPEEDFVEHFRLVFFGEVRLYSVSFVFDWVED